MDQKDLHTEEKHLKEVIELVEDQQKVLTRRLKEIGAENLDRLSDLRSDPETGTDFLMLLDQLHEKNEAFNLKDKYQRLEEFSYLQNNPYFARIDIQDKNSKKTHQIYIGKFGFSTDYPVVIDWRAGIASVYYRYRYPQKDVEYNTELGKEKHDLLLKRTFDIFNGKLVKYYNNDIQFDEKDIIIEKIEKRTGGVLEDIIETIQQDQMDIIEADPRQICIVQGCVGSGKSTVAIHKLAHIFFNYSNYIHPEKSILVVKSQILISYLATLFPKLGIFDINFKTLRDLIVNALFREELPIKVELDEKQDTSEFTLDKITEIYNRIDSIYNLYSQKTDEIFANPDFESYGGYKFSKDISIYANFVDILDELNEELDAQNEIIKENPKSMRALIAKDNIKNIRKVIRRINDLRHSLKHEVFFEVLSNYVKDYSKKLNYLETLIYMFIWGKLIGFSKVYQYEYCVVDEGQDFSLLEYAVLGQFVIRGRMGIFGDLNQSLNADGIAKWDEIKEVIVEAKRANVFKLDTIYRSTKPIIELANKILSEYTSDYLPKSVNRTGEEPEIIKTHDENEIMKLLKERIEADLNALDKSIGIICANDGLLDKVEVLLKDHNSHIIKLDRSKKINYISKGVYYMKLEDCKGLEFSKVYILGMNLDKIDNDIEARRAFVAVTRAMNELVVMGN